MKHAMFCASLAMLAIAIGCGGGISTVQTDAGYGGSAWGYKTITRTIENDTSAGAEVVLYVNGTDYLDTVYVGPYDGVTVTIDNLYADDFVYFSAAFDTGDVVTGAFSEDGDTVFTFSGRSHVTAKERSGTPGNRPGAKRLTLHAKHHQR